MLLLRLPVPLHSLEGPKRSLKRLQALVLEQTPDGLILRPPQPKACYVDGKIRWSECGHFSAQMHKHTRPAEMKFDKKEG